MEKILSGWIMQQQLKNPSRLLERLNDFYEHENSNVHRGAHTLAARATDAYEAARQTVSKFLHASSAQDIVFVRGATEAINLVAQSWAKYNILHGDEIVVSWLEHHANIVPWQVICTETGAKLRVIPVDSSGQILLRRICKIAWPLRRNLWQLPMYPMHWEQLHLWLI